MAKIEKPVPPALPIAPGEYNTLFQDQYSNVLRLYFNRLSNAVVSLLGPAGGQFVDMPNGLFFNTAEQFFAATNTGYPVVFDQTYLNNFVSLQSGSTSRVTVDKGGVYNFQYSGQMTSASASAKTMYIWIRRNGTNIGYSTRGYTLANNNSLFAIAWNFNIDMQAGDYIELIAAVDDTDLHLHTQTAVGSIPSMASGVLTVNYISPLPTVIPTPPT